MKLFQDTGFWAAVRREAYVLVSRPIYIFGILLVPICSILFMLDLMKDGLPNRIPAAIVDLDNSPATRKIQMQLNSLETVSITEKYESYTEAYQALQRGEIFGFFVVPSNFEQDALSGRKPQITFYTNMTFYVPGSLLYKSFKTMAVLTGGAIVQTVMLNVGMPSSMVMPMLMPIATDVHPLGNPWINYSVYLCNSFLPCLIQLMVLLMTAFSIGMEIKYQRSRSWLRSAGDNVLIAILAKLLPQTIMFTIVGFFLQSMMYGYGQFPLNCPLWHMLLAMFLMVVATQSFALVIVSAVPNLRISLSVCSLVGVLSFSVAGFSFAVDSMYSYIGIFSYILPVRHYFLIYATQALNGFPLYFSRWHYLVLMAFIIAPLPLLPRLKKAMIRQEYVP